MSIYLVHSWPVQIYFAVMTRLMCNYCSRKPLQGCHVDNVILCGGKAWSFLKSYVQFFLIRQLPLLVSSMVSLYFLEWTDVFKPVRWGFSCHDRSLSLPYIEPTHEVIPFLMLLSLAFAAPAIAVSSTIHLYTQIHTYCKTCFLFENLREGF